MDNKKGFTLVEMLIVIAIIAVLVAIMVPVLRNALEKSREVKCKSNLRNIALAMIAFADDHDGHLPATINSSHPSIIFGSRPEWQKPFMGKEVIPSSNDFGTLVPYLPVNQESAHKVYLCPSNRKESNGMFDYTMMTSLAGVLLHRIPGTMYINENSQRVELPTALVVEQSSATLISDPDPAFQGDDEFAYHHGDGKEGYYCAVDGSVNSMLLKSNGNPVTANDCHTEVNNIERNLGQPSNTIGLLPWDQP